MSYYPHYIPIPSEPGTNLSRSSFLGIRKHMHSYSFLFGLYNFHRFGMDFSDIH